MPSLEVVLTCNWGRGLNWEGDFSGFHTLSAQPVFTLGRCPGVVVNIGCSPGVPRAEVTGEGHFTPLAWLLMAASTLPQPLPPATSDQHFVAPEGRVSDLARHTLTQGGPRPDTGTRGPGGWCAALCALSGRGSVPRWGWCSWR